MPSGLLRLANERSVGYLAHGTAVDRYQVVGADEQVDRLRINVIIL
jgi:hypothetical protein